MHIYIVEHSALKYESDFNVQKLLPIFHLLLLAIIFMLNRDVLFIVNSVGAIVLLRMHILY